MEERLQSLNHVLATRVENGDSVVQLRSLLGHADLPTGRQRDLLLKAARDFASQSRDEYADGVLPGDGFLGYKVGTDGTVMYLQFRDDRLVNFHPHVFERSAEVTGLGR